METLDATAIPPIAWRIEDDGTLVIAPPAGSERGLIAHEEKDHAIHRNYSGSWTDSGNCERVTAVRVEPGVVAPGSLRGLFNYMENLVTADLSGMDVSAVEDLSGLFFGCRKLESVHFGAWDTARVTSMASMFGRCAKLAELDVVGWDVSSVKDMTGMFRGCASLPELDLSRWDVRAARLDHMFRGCTGRPFRGLLDEPGGRPLAPQQQEGSLPEAAWSIDDDGLLTVAPPPGCSEAILSTSETLIDQGTPVVAASWDAERRSIRHVRVEPGVVAGESLRGLFLDCVHLKDADLSALDVSRTVSMREMFGHCPELECIDASGWNTASLEDASGMFRDCRKLTRTPAGELATARLRTARGLFAGCVNLRDVDLSRWDTSSLVNVDGMLRGCLLCRLDLGGWPKELSARVMRDLVAESGYQDSLPPAVWSVDEGGALTVMPPVGFERALLKMGRGQYPWNECKYKSPLFYRFLSAASDYSHSRSLPPWNRLRITSARFEPGVVAPESIDNLFAQHTFLKSVDFRNLDISGTTDLHHLCACCESLTSVEFGDWDTSRVTSVRGAFQLCTSLTAIDLSGWDVSQVQDASYLLDCCEHLRTARLGGWGLRCATDLSFFFRGCRDLKDLDMSGWLLGDEPVNMREMFRDCRSLTQLDFSSWDVKAGNMLGMFFDCRSLRTLSLRGWDVAGGWLNTLLFGNCLKLVKLDLSGWTVHDDFSLRGEDLLFQACDRLKQPILEGCDSETKRRILEQYERPRFWPDSWPLRLE